MRMAIAVVWTPYAFHVDRELSHCGVDAFSLVDGGDGEWKIAGVVYTVESPTDYPDRWTSRRSRGPSRTDADEPPTPPLVSSEGAER